MISVVLDTETTALIKNRAQPIRKQPKIIEYYSVKIDDNGNKISELDQLIHPGSHILKETTEITKITNEMLEGKPSFQEVFPSIVEQIESSDCVIAHNLAYDKSVLDFESSRIGKSIIWPSNLICTVEASMGYKGYRLSLTALHEFLFGAGFPSAHRARFDVEALVRCVVEMRKRQDL